MFRKAVHITFIVCLLSIFSYHNVAYGEDSAATVTEERELGTKEEAVDHAIEDYNDIHEALATLITFYNSNKTAIEQSTSEIAVTVTAGIINPVVTEPCQQNALSSQGDTQIRRY